MDRVWVPENLGAFYMQLINTRHYRYDANGKLISVTPMMQGAHAQVDPVPTSIASVINGIEPAALPCLITIPELRLHYCVLSKVEHPDDVWLLSVSSNNQAAEEVVHNLPIGVMQFDAGWRNTFVNHQACHFLGVTAGELIGHGWRDFVPKALISDLYHHLETLGDRPETFEKRVDLVSPLGRSVTLLVNACFVTNRATNNPNCMLSMLDISSQVVVEKALRRLSREDSATQLLNRRAFWEHVSGLSMAQFVHGVLLFIDVTRFKQINDTYGHAAGDQVLKLIAKRMRQTARDSDLIGRIGGDEFLMFMPEVDDRSSVDAICQKVIAAVAGDASVLGRQLQLHIAVGAVWVSDLDFSDLTTHAEQYDRMLSAADEAMYSAKQHASGNSGYRIYDNALHLNNERERLRRDEFHQVSAGDGLFALMQPIYDSNHDVVKVEALARCRIPLQHHANIEELIATAELVDQPFPFFMELTRVALRSFGSAKLAPQLALNLNIDVRQLTHKDFIPELTRCCANANVAPSRVSLELTEAAFDDNNPAVEFAVNALRKHGYAISMDDFGTGFSSLKRLMMHPFDELKVDKFFVQHLGAEQKYEQALKTILAVGHSLDMKVVAEGVETEAQYQLCNALGVDYFQGYLLARPQPPSRLHS